MARAFTSADVVQGDGNAGTLTTPSISLPGPATAGNGGIIVMFAGSVVAPPDRFHTAASSGTSSLATQMAIMCRTDLEDGDQAWTFDTLSPGAAAIWTWRVEEWTNLSYAPIAGSANVTAAINLSSVTIGPTETFWTSPQYVIGIAAVGLASGSASTVPWPTVTWSDGFTETDTYQVGNGAGEFGTANYKLHVARRYGTLDETGPWSTTATFSNSGTTGTRTTFACMAVFRAESHVGEA